MKIKVIRFVVYDNNKSERAYAGNKKFSVHPVIIDYKGLDREVSSIFNSNSEKTCLRKAKELELRLINCRGRVYWDHGNIVWDYNG